MLDNQNEHILFTTSLPSELLFLETEIFKNVLVVQIPFSISKGSLIKRKEEITEISEYITNYIQSNSIRVDIMFGHSQLTNFYILGRVRNLLRVRIPLIWEFNAIWGAIDVIGVKNILARAILRYFERRIVREANGLIFQTYSSLNWVRRKYGNFKCPHLVVTNAVPFDASGSFSFKKLPSMPRKVLVNGLFDSMNGLGIVVDALAKGNLVGGLELHFYGHGPWSTELKKFHNGKSIFYHGFIPREEMALKYFDFDFILIPRVNSVEAELFIPSKLLEAMGCGVVPIVSNVKGMTEVVDSNIGIVFDSNSVPSLHAALECAVSLSSSQWEDLSASSRNLISRSYVWSGNHKILNRFYLDILTN